MLLKYLRTQIENRVKNWLLRLTSSPLLGYLPPFVPYESGRNTYMIPVAAHPEGRRVSHDFPVPPKELWLGYGTTAEVYLEAGRHHVNRMLQITEGSGWSLPADARVMDFGCGAGRMARWLVEKVPDGEIWGTDISAPHITWCQQNLTPPIHFVTTTTMPHLPFEDNSFDFMLAPFFHTLMIWLMPGFWNYAVLPGLAAEFLSLLWIKPAFPCFRRINGRISGLAGMCWRIANTERTSLRNSVNSRLAGLYRRKYSIIATSLRGNSPAGLPCIALYQKPTHFKQRSFLKKTATNRVRTYAVALLRIPTLCVSPAAAR